MEKNMLFLTQYDSAAALWQIYLSNSGSITMERILISNKYLFFLLTIIVIIIVMDLYLVSFFYTRVDEELKKSTIHLSAKKQKNIPMGIIIPVANPISDIFQVIKK